MPLDITEMNAPKSDQLDAVDLTFEGRTFTVAGVNRNSSDDQPLNVRLEGFPRVWRPSKGMRRVLAYVWGQDAEQYVGRRLHLYTDPEVEFGGQKVGGIRIRAVSHITKPMQAPVLIKRGRAGLLTIQPLKDEPKQTQQPTGPTPEQVAASTDVGELRGMYRAASPQVRDLIRARVEALDAAHDTQEQAPPPADTDQGEFLEDAFPEGDQ